MITLAIWNVKPPQKQTKLKIESLFFERKNVIRTVYPKQEETPTTCFKRQIINHLIQLNRIFQSSRPTQVPLRRHVAEGALVLKETVTYYDGII